MNWQNLGGFSLTAVVIFISGWIIKQWLENKIKSEVQHKYEKELESFKHGLIVETAERQLRFSQVYSETVKVICQFHRQLVECDRTASLALNEEVFEEEAWDALEKAESELADLWLLNNLYFPPECEARINDALRLRVGLIRLLDKYIKAKRANDMPSAYALKLQYEENRKQYIVMVGFLGKEFRYYMGVEQNPSEAKS